MTTPLPTVTLTHERGVTTAVPGEPIGAHLAVTPAFTDNGLDQSYTGRWTVTHVATGYAVIRVGACIHHTRAAARLLADCGVDWTRPADWYRTDPTAKAAAQAARDLLAGCSGDYLDCAEATEVAEGRTFTAVAA
jgi:hypothetical protein